MFINLSKKYLMVFVLIIAIVIASIPIIVIIVANNQKKENIQIGFIPNQIKSCPNHTAWLLLDIRTRSSNLMSNLSLQLNTNRSIEIEYEIWENSPLNKLVEVFLSPNSSHIHNLIEIEATVSCGGITKKDYAIVQVINWTIVIDPEVQVMRDKFIHYLSNNHTNFKINGSTKWEGLGNAPQILVVEHYLFKSAYWEMELARHITIAPNDWVEIYLRPRSSLFPNWSGRINSWSSGNHSIVEIEPPDEIRR